jgi:hypothetical protein
LKSVEKVLTTLFPYRSCFSFVFARALLLAIVVGRHAAAHRLRRWRGGARGGAVTGTRRATCDAAELLLRVAGR